jgi:Flp pilus assembly protein TadB
MTSRVPHWVQYLSGVVLIGLGIFGIRESAHGKALLVWAVAIIVGILLIVLPLRRARRKR